MSALSAPGGTACLCSTKSGNTPLLWLLVLVPVVLVAHALSPMRTRCCSCFPSRRSCRWQRCSAARRSRWRRRTGDTIGGLLNATLGNLTELIIALAALRAGQYVLVKASIAGAIVTNALFMLGVAFLLGGLKHHVQEYNRNSARLQAGLLFLATIAMLVPSVLAEAEPAPPRRQFTQTLSLCLSVLLIVTYALGLLFSLKTHREFFAAAEHGDVAREPNGRCRWR